MGEDGYWPSGPPERDTAGWLVSLRYEWSYNNRWGFDSMAPWQLIMSNHNRWTTGIDRFVAVYWQGEWTPGDDHLFDALHAQAASAWPELVERPLDVGRIPMWEDVLAARYPAMSDDAIDAWLRVGQTRERPHPWEQRHPARVACWQAEVPTDWTATIAAPLRLLMVGDRLLAAGPMPAPVAYYWPPFTASGGVRDGLDGWAGGPLDPRTMWHIGRLARDAMELETWISDCVPIWTDPSPVARPTKTLWPNPHARDLERIGYDDRIANVFEEHRRARRLMVLVRALQQAVEHCCDDIDRAGRAGDATTVDLEAVLRDRDRLRECILAVGELLPGPRVVGGQAET